MENKQTNKKATNKKKKKKKKHQNNPHLNDTVPFEGECNPVSI